MSECLPPEIASLLPNGERVALDDLSIADVRAILAASATRIREAIELADEYKASGKRDLFRARRAEAALRELVALKDIKEGLDQRPHQPLHDDYLRRKPLAWQAAREVLDDVPLPVRSLGLMA